MGESRFESALVKTRRTLAAPCKAGTEAEALKTRHAGDYISVEALVSPKGREAQGRDAIQGKHE